MTVLVLAASPTSAQDARQLDLSVGYLNVGGSMHGVNAQVTVPLTRRWSFVGEFDGSYGRDCADCDPKYRDLAGLGGFRYAWQPNVKVSPFWQILVGGLHSTAAEYYAELCCGLGRRLQPADTVNYFAFQPGVGMTVMVTRRLGVRAQADLQFAVPGQAEEPSVSVFPRVAVGGVILLGSRR